MFEVVQKNIEQGENFSAKTIDFTQHNLNLDISELQIIRDYSQKKINKVITFENYLIFGTEQNGIDIYVITFGSINFLRNLKKDNYNNNISDIYFNSNAMSLFVLDKKIGIYTINILQDFQLEDVILAPELEENVNMVQFSILQQETSKKLFQTIWIAFDNNVVKEYIYLQQNQQFQENYSQQLQFDVLKMDFVQEFIVITTTQQLLWKMHSIAQTQQQNFQGQLQTQNLVTTIGSFTSSINNNNGSENSEIFLFYGDSYEIKNIKALNGQLTCKYQEQSDNNLHLKFVLKGYSKQCSGKGLDNFNYSKICQFQQNIYVDNYDVVLVSSGKGLYIALGVVIAIIIIFTFVLILYYYKKYSDEKKNIQKEAEKQRAQKYEMVLEEEEKNSTQKQPRIEDQEAPQEEHYQV